MVYVILVTDFLLESTLSVGVFGIPFVHDEEAINASALESRSKISVPSPLSTPSPDQARATVSALPLVPANNSGVSTASVHPPIISLSQIFLRSDSDLHLSRFVARDRGGQCGETITDLRPGDRGFIRSPNYPQDYPPDVKCTWWLKAKVSCVCYNIVTCHVLCQDNAKIQMTCTDVRTQSCDGGYYDYILVSPDWTWEKYYL